MEVDSSFKSSCRVPIVLSNLLLGWKVFFFNVSMFNVDLNRFLCSYNYFYFPLRCYTVIDTH